EQSQLVPPILAEIPAIKNGGLDQADQSQQSSSHQRGGASGKGIPSWGHWRSIGEDGHTPGLAGGKESEEKQRPDPQQRDHPTQEVPKAPGRKGRGVGHSKNGHAVQHLPPIEQNDQ